VELLEQWAPIGISVVSLLLSGIALGWNVYRDIVLKARVRVSFSVVTIVTPGQKVAGGPRYLRIDVTNFGPGPVRIVNIAGQQSSLLRRIFRRPQHFVILNDYTNPLNPQLPHKLEVGDNAPLLLPYDRKCFLKDKPSHIGITDSFGRAHYAPRRDLKDSISQYKAEFSDLAAT
jgi:hypothetical protein